MRFILFATTVLFLFSACSQSGKKAKEVDISTKIQVNQVFQTDNYTYLNASSKTNPGFWIAIPRIEIETGSEFYITEGLVMKNFRSKELNQVFDEILFLDDLYTEPVFETVHGSGTQSHTGSVMTEKQDLSIEAVSEGTTIAELFASPKKYKGKEITVKGKVTKFNPAIMDRNWVHIQDGTESDGQFDLTITTDASLAPGDTAVFRGKVSLDKDFGYGYFYEIILEDAKLVE